MNTVSYVSGANPEYAAMAFKIRRSLMRMVNLSKPTFPKKVEVAEKPVEETVKPEKETKPKAKRTRKKTAVITEDNNKEEKTESDMDENIEKIKQVMGNDVEIPERKVKVEKRDKGLLERTENSTTLITEDNKLVLND